MLRHCYEYWVFKSVSWQGGFVLLLVFTAVGINYFSFAREEISCLKQQALKNKTLEQQLQDEKSRLIKLKKAPLKTQVDHKVLHYLENSKNYSKPERIVESLMGLAEKENVTVKHISLEPENLQKDHMQFLIHLSLHGNYREFTKFYFAMSQQPYLIKRVRFKLEKISQEYGGDTLYADLFIHVHAFTEV